MNELRVALIVIGAVFLAVLMLWERRRSARKTRPLAQPEQPTATVSAAPRVRRLEPSIDEFSPGEEESASFDFPAIHPVEPVRVEVMREVAVDIPGAASASAAAPPESTTTSTPEPAPEQTPEPAPVPASLPTEIPVLVAAAPPAAPPAIRWPPARTERVLTARIVRADGQALQGRAVRLALEGAGMVHGPQRIYHRVDANGAVRASAANLVRPGSLDPAQLDAQELRGLSLFCILPGPVSAPQMLDDLLQLARTISDRVGAVVQDEQGVPLEGERLAMLKRSLSPPAAMSDGSPA